MATSLLVDPGLVHALRAPTIAPQNSQISSLISTQTLNSRGVPYRQHGLYWFWTSASALANGLGYPNGGIASSTGLIPQPVVAGLRWVIIQVILKVTRNVPDIVKLQVPLVLRKRGFQTLCQASRDLPSAALYNGMATILTYDLPVRKWALLDPGLSVEDRRVHQQVFEGSLRFKGLDLRFQELEKSRRMPLGEHYTRRIWFDPRSESWMLETLWLRPGIYHLFPKRVSWTRIRYSRNWLAPKLLMSETDPAHRGQHLYSNAVRVLTEGKSRAWEFLTEPSTLADLYDAIPPPIRQQGDPDFAEDVTEKLYEKGLRGKNLERHATLFFDHAVKQAIRRSRQPTWYLAVLQQSVQGKPLYESGLTKLELVVDHSGGNIQLTARRENVAREDVESLSPHVELLFDKLDFAPGLDAEHREALGGFIARFEDRFGHLPPKTMLRELYEQVQRGTLSYPIAHLFLSWLGPGADGRTNYTQKFRDFIESFDYMSEIQDGTLTVELDEMPEAERAAITPVRLYWAASLIQQDNLSPADVYTWIQNTNEIHARFTSQMAPLRQPVVGYPTKFERASQHALEREARSTYMNDLWTAIASFSQSHAATFSQDPAFVLRLLGAALQDDMSDAHHFLYQALRPGSDYTYEQTLERFVNARQRRMRLAKQKSGNVLPFAPWRRARGMSVEEKTLITRAFALLTPYKPDTSVADIVGLSQDPPDKIRRFYSDAREPASEAVQAILSGKVVDWEFTFDDVVESLARRPFGAVSKIYPSILKEISEELRVIDPELPLDRSLIEAFQEMKERKHKAFPHYAEVLLFLQRVEAARLAAEGATISGITPYVAEHMRNDLELYTYGVQTFEILHKPIVRLHKKAGAASYRLAREGDLLHLRPETKKSSGPVDKVEQVRAQLRQRGQRAAATLMAFTAIPFLTAFTGSPLMNWIGGSLFIGLTSGLLIYRYRNILLTVIQHYIDLHEAKSAVQVAEREFEKMGVDPQKSRQALAQAKQRLKNLQNTKILLLIVLAMSSSACATSTFFGVSGWGLPFGLMMGMMYLLLRVYRMLFRGNSSDFRITPSQNEHANHHPWTRLPVKISNSGSSETADIIGLDDGSGNGKLYLSLAASSHGLIPDGIVEAHERLARAEEVYRRRLRDYINVDPEMRPHETEISRLYREAEAALGNAKAYLAGKSTRHTLLKLAA